MPIEPLRCRVPALCRPFVLLLLSGLASAAASLGCASADSREVLVLAAASTIDAMEAAVAGFGDEAGATRIHVSFASSSVLARQIEEGAPADLLLSASVAWADYVEARVAVARRISLVGNELTVVAPAGTDTPHLSLEEIGASERITRVAIADPESVPAGIYASEALRRAGLWKAFEGRLIPTVDARASLTLVADGEADAGFVYATDAAATPRVRVIARVDPKLHRPIEYPLLLLGDSRAEAVRFYDYLISERGREHFRAHGFLDTGR